MPKRQRRYVEKENILHFALQHARLNGGTDGHHFVRVHALVGLLAEELLYDFDDLGHARHAAHQNNFLDLACGDARILQGLAAGLNGLLDEIIHKGLELGARQLQGEMLRTRGIRRDEGQVDFGLGRGRQFDLGLFSRFAQALEGQLVLAQIDGLLFLEFIGEVIDDAHVEVFTAEEGVAVGGLHFEDAVTDFENRDVEGAAAQVVNRDEAGFRLVEAIGQVPQRSAR